MTFLEMNRPATPFEYFLRPAASLFAWGAALRGRAYERGWFKSFDVGVPVVSIGNLTAGGTGKTPMTALFVEGLRARGLRVGIISRGYGGTHSEISASASTGASVSASTSARGGPMRVPVAQAVADRTRHARCFGDEPVWLAARFPDVPVFVGTDKVATALALSRENRNENSGKNKIDLILADDAFQHRRLKRGLDVVLLDASEPRWHYRPLPLGRMREGFEALSRAHAIFITKANLAAAGQIDWLRTCVGESAGGATEIFEIDFVITGFTLLEKARDDARGVVGADTDTDADGLIAASELAGRRLVLASGIGRPRAFADLVRASTGAEIVEHCVFRDHQVYSTTDLESVVARARAACADHIVVTEKDAVKMSGWNPSVPVLVSRLEARPARDLGEFYEEVGRLVL